MTSRRPRWAWLLFPHLSLIAVATVLAALHRLPAVVLGGGLDKVGHFLMLGTLSLLAVGFFGRARWPRVVGVLAMLSGVEELSQAWFPARTLDGGDLAANLMGVVLGAYAGTRLTRGAAGYSAGTVASPTRDKPPHLPISPDDDTHDADRPPVRARP
jgi:VanZ family protein